MKTKCIALALVILFILSGCQRTPPPANEAFTVGSYEGHDYHNSYFGMTFMAPPDWNICTRAQLEEIYKLPPNTLDESDAGYVDRYAEMEFIPLGIVSKQSIDETGNNANITILAQKLEGSDTLETNAIVDGLSAGLSDRGFTLLSRESVTISGTDFTLLQGSSDSDIHQRLYTTRQSGYLILFTATYFDESEGDTLDAVIHSIQFT